MSLAFETREMLKAQQAALVGALLAGAPMPAGFDNARLRAAANSLARKRARAAANAWPRLAATLGSNFTSQFTAFAATQPLPRTGGPLADGRGFVHWLARQNPLPDAVRIEAFMVDLHQRTSTAGLTPRRGPVFRLALLRRPWRLLVGLRVPFAGVFCFRIPLTWRD